MGIYGSNLHEDIELINEGFIVGLSKDGKDLKKELKEKIKRYDKKFNFGKAMTTNYDKNIQSNVEKLIRNKFDKLFVSVIYEETYTSSNGASSTSFIQQFVGLYKNNLYTFKVNYVSSKAHLYTFKELNLEKCIIPADLIQNVLIWNRRNYLLHITKNKIKMENLSSSSFDDSIFSKIISYCEDKHPELDCKVNKLIHSISFKIKK